MSGAWGLCRDGGGVVEALPDVRFASGLALVGCGPGARKTVAPSVGTAVGCLRGLWISVCAALLRWSWWLVAFWERAKPRTNCFWRSTPHSLSLLRGRPLSAHRGVRSSAVVGLGHCPPRDHLHGRGDHHLPRPWLRMGGVGGGDSWCTASAYGPTGLRLVPEDEPTVRMARRGSKDAGVVLTLTPRWSAGPGFVNPNCSSTSEMRNGAAYGDVVSEYAARGRSELREVARAGMSVTSGRR